MRWATRYMGQRRRQGAAARISYTQHRQGAASRAVPHPYAVEVGTVKSLVALWLGVEGLTDQPAAIGHTEGWSAIARGLCGLETSDATLREGSRLKAGGFRSGRGVPLAHAPVLSDPSVEEGGDVGPFGIVALVGRGFLCVL